MACDQGAGRRVSESPSSGVHSSSGRTGVLPHAPWRHLLPEGEGTRSPSPKGVLKDARLSTGYGERGALHLLPEGEGGRV
jgi:hypothetical protein